jgi:membrane protease YdiL (CAAX protease family)
VPSEDERIETSCACGLVWWVQRTLGGHRLRCECGAWVEVPAPPAGLVAGGPLSVALPPMAAPAPRRPDYSQPPASYDELMEVPTSHAMEENSLRHAPVETRRKWTSRGLLELVGIVAAFLLPPILLQVLSDDRALLVYLPVTDLVSCLLVLAVGMSAPHYTFDGIRRAETRHFVEGIGVALGLSVLALLWTGAISGSFGEGDNIFRELREELGLLWTLLLVGAVPGVFEELAFRGLLQGRLSALHGRTGGILLSGIAFALAHGYTLGLPFHIAGGFYLGWLRVRAHSIYPCMLTHLVYNSTLVFALSG